MRFLCHFKLVRTEAASGISGTGVVAIGVKFPDKPWPCNDSMTATTMSRQNETDWHCTPLDQVSKMLLKFTDIAVG